MLRPRRTPSPENSGPPGVASQTQASETALSPKQERTLLALLTEPTITAAADASKVGERTLRRWLSESGFVNAYRLARRDNVSHATARLQHAATGAVHTLVSVMEDREATHSARVSAARTVLEETRRATELEDLAERVTALEGAAMPNGRKG